MVCVLFGCDNSRLTHIVYVPLVWQLHALRAAQQDQPKPKRARSAASRAKMKLHDRKQMTSSFCCAFLHQSWLGADTAISQGILSKAKRSSFIRRRKTMLHPTQQKVDQRRLVLDVEEERISKFVLRRQRCVVIGCLLHRVVLLDS